MGSMPQHFDPEHPLQKDRERLEKIFDVMYAKIQKILFPGNRGTPRSDRVDRIIEGTAVSAEDVLSEAAISLLQYPPHRLDGEWEGLAVTIARNKAVSALRAAGKGLRGTEHRPPLRLVSGDAEREGPGGEPELPLFEVIPSNYLDPEAEFAAMEAVLVLRDLVRDILDERAREIFFAIHFEGYSRKEVGERLGLTSQRIGQIYNTALRRLEAHPDYPFKPS